MLATVVLPCIRPAHMWGVPAAKSWRMIVTTTLVPCECAVLSSELSWLEFHTLNPESAANVPSSWTCSPKNATVLSSEKSHVVKPTVVSLRLLANANPNTSRTGPPAPPTAACGPALVNGCSEPVLALATWFAACCITDRWPESGFGVGEDAATAPAGTKPHSATVARSNGTRCLIRCIDIGGIWGLRTLHACCGERQIRRPPSAEGRKQVQPTRPRDYPTWLPT